MLSPSHTLQLSNRSLLYVMVRSGRFATVGWREDVYAMLARGACSRVQSDAHINTTEEARIRTVLASFIPYHILMDEPYHSAPAKAPGSTSVCVMVRLDVPDPSPNCALAASVRVRSQKLRAMNASRAMDALKTVLTIVTIDVESSNVKSGPCSPRHRRLGHRLGGGHAHPDTRTDNVAT